MKKSTKKKGTDLSVIILNYNSGEFLKNCLLSLEKAKTDDFSCELIVVDNVSTDNSLNFARNWKTGKLSLKLIENNQNLGFAAGNNVGVKKTTGRYLLFLNPDTIVYPNTLKEMVRFMEQHPGVGAVTCRVELPSGELDKSCHRGFPTPWRAFCHFSGLEKLFPQAKVFSGYTLGWKALDKIHEIDSGAGSFLMVKREAGEKVGWWDEDYFFYGEDLDLCYRIKQAGWKIYYVPKVKITHFKGISSGIRKESQKMSKADKETKIKAIDASVQAMRIFYKKHYLNKYPKFLTWMVLKGIDILEKIRLKKLSI